MPAYARFFLNQFAETNSAEIVGMLEEAYAADGFSS